MAAARGAEELLHVVVGRRSGPREQVIKAVQDAQTHVPLAIGQVQASFRAAMRADDAQVRV